MSLLALSWLTEVGLMTWRIAHQGRPAAQGGGKVPWPSDFVASFVVYGALSVMAEIGGGWDKVAATAGWGLVLATVLNLVDPTNPTHAAGKLPAPLDRVSKVTGPGLQGTAQPGVPNPLSASLGG